MVGGSVDELHLGAQRLFAILAMCTGEALLTCSDTLAKHVLQGLGSAQVLCLRSGLIFALILAYCGVTASIRTISTRKLMLHLVRSVIGCAAVLAFFESLRALPITVAVTLGLLTPPLCLVSGSLFLRERPSLLQCASVLGAFTGALLVVWRPTDATNSGYGVAMGLASSALFAVSWVIVPAIGKADHPICFIFYLNLACIAIAGPLSLPLPHMDIGSVAGIVGMAALTLLGQFLVIKAYLGAPVSLVSPFKYSDIIWAQGLAFIIWRETPGVLVLFGSVIMVGSGALLMSTRRN